MRCEGALLSISKEKIQTGQDLVIFTFLIQEISISALSNTGSNAKEHMKVVSWT